MVEEGSMGLSLSRTLRRDQDRPFLTASGSWENGRGKYGSSDSTSGAGRDGIA